MHDGPELTTPRLRLRWFTEDDAGLMLEIWNNPDFVRFVGDRGIRTLEQSREALQRGAITAYQRSGYGPFHVALTDGTPVGICGLFERDELDYPDIGFAVVEAQRRHGYALEASLAVLDYCDSVLKLARIAAIVAPGNLASLALVEKLGMRFVRKLRLAGDTEDVHLFCRHRP